MWRRRELVAEAVLSLGVRSVLLAALALILSGGVSAMMVTQTQRIIAQEMSRINLGSLVWTLRADAGTGVSSLRCQSLGQEQVVLAVGGVAHEPGPMAQRFSRGLSVPVEYVLPGSWRVWTHTDPEVPGVGIGSELAAAIGVGEGGELWVGHERLRPITVSDRRAALPPRLSSAVLLPRADEFQLAECWILMEPGAFDDGEALLRFRFADASAEVVPHLRAPTGVTPPSEQWSELVRLGLWILLPVPLSLAVALLTWTRRAEIAVYRAFGTTRTEVVSVLTTEYAVSIVLGSIAGAVVALLGSAALRGVTSIAAYAAIGSQVLAGCLASVALLVPVVWVFARGGILTGLRDR